MINKNTFLSEEIVWPVAYISIALPLLFMIESFFSFIGLRGGVSGLFNGTITVVISYILANKIKSYYIKRKTSEKEDDNHG